jgi:hypothetical protein
MRRCVMQHAVCKTVVQGVHLEAALVMYPLLHWAQALPVSSSKFVADSYGQSSTVVCILL